MVVLKAAIMASPDRAISTLFGIIDRHYSLVKYDRIEELAILLIALCVTIMISNVWSPTSFTQVL